MHLQFILFICFMFVSNSALAQVSTDGDFKWKFTTIPESQTSLPSCQQLGITLIGSGEAPYYMQAFVIDGTPTTTPIGSSANDLHWQATYPEGTQLLLAVVDAKGRNGGYSTSLYTVSGTCNSSPASISISIPLYSITLIPMSSVSASVIVGGPVLTTMTIPPIQTMPYSSQAQPTQELTFSTNVTGELSTCQPVKITIQGGVQPYTIVVVALNYRDMENITIAKGDNTFTYIEGADPGTQLLIAVSDADENWASGPTPIFSITGSANTDCSEKSSSSKSPDSEVIGSDDGNVVSSSGGYFSVESYSTGSSSDGYFSTGSSSDGYFSVGIYHTGSSSGSSGESPPAGSYSTGSYSAGSYPSVPYSASLSSTVGSAGLPSQTHDVGPSTDPNTDPKSRGKAIIGACAGVGTLFFLASLLYAARRYRRRKEQEDLRAIPDVFSNMDGDRDVNYLHHSIPPVIGEKRQTSVSSPMSNSSEAQLLPDSIPLQSSYQSPSGNAGPGDLVALGSDSTGQIIVRHRDAGTAQVHELPPTYGNFIPARRT